MRGLYRWEALEGDRLVEWAQVQYDTGAGPMRRDEYEAGILEPDFRALPTKEEYEASKNA